MRRARWRLKGPVALLVDRALPWERRKALLSIEDADLDATTDTLAAPEVAELLREHGAKTRRAADVLPEVLELFGGRLPTADERASSERLRALAHATGLQAERFESKGREGRRGGGAAGSPVLARRDRAVQRWLHGLIAAALEARDADPAVAAARALAEVLEPLPGVGEAQLLAAVRSALTGRARRPDTRARAVLDGLRDELDASEWDLPQLAPLSERHWRRILER